MRLSLSPVPLSSSRTALFFHSFKLGLGFGAFPGKISSQAHIHPEKLYTDVLCECALTYESDKVLVSLDRCNYSRPFLLSLFQIGLCCPWIWSVCWKNSGGMLSRHYACIWITAMSLFRGSGTRRRQSLESHLLSGKRGRPVFYSLYVPWEHKYR